MFKKTLLALAIAGASVSANAGILTVDVTNNDSDKYDAASYDVVGGCATAATELNVVASNNDNYATDGISIVTGGNSDTIYDRNAVVYTDDNTCTVYVADALVKADDAKYSEEGASAKGLTISASLITGVGGVKAEDTIEITVEGGTIDEDASANATLNDGTGLTILGVTGSTIRFTVDSGVSADTFGPRYILALKGLVVKPEDGGDSISLSSTTRNTAGVQYDESASAKIVNIEKQFSTEGFVDADGIIDVATERFDFEANDDDSSNTALNQSNEGKLKDTLIIKNTLNTTQGNLTAGTASLVIKGNFSWIADHDAVADAFTFKAYDGETDGVLTVGAGEDTYTSGASLNSDKTELTIPVTVNASGSEENNDIVDEYYAVTFNVVGSSSTDPKAETSLETTDFEATLSFKNDTAADGTTSTVTLKSVEDEDVGEWTLNGSVVEVPYIPFGPNTQPVIRHTNTGSQTGDISVRYMVEEGNGHAQSNTWQSLGVLVEDAKPGVRNLLNVVTEALENALGNDKFKVALEITTNVPAEDVTVYAAAKVSNAEGQDRLTIGAFKGQTEDKK